ASARPSGAAGSNSMSSPGRRTRTPARRSLLPLPEHSPSSSESGGVLTVRVIIDQVALARRLQPVGDREPDAGMHGRDILCVHAGAIVLESGDVIQSVPRLMVNDDWPRLAAELVHPWPRSRLAC